MAKTEIFKEAVALSLPVPAGTLEGVPLRIGSLNVVTETAEGSVKDPTYGLELGSLSGNSAGYASCKLNGAHMLQVAGAVASVGLPIYITSTNTLTATSTGNYLFGLALRTKGTGTGSLLVKILQPADTAARA